MAALQRRQRAVGHVGVGQIAADGEDVVIGVREELDVLMPFHRVGGVEPFEVQFGVVEDDVRPHKVRRHIRHQAGGEPPIGVMLDVGRFQAAEDGFLRRMLRRHVERVVRGADRTALVLKLSRDAL